MYAFRTIPKTGRRRHIPADKTDTFLRDNGGKVLNLRRKNRKQQMKCVRRGRSKTGVSAKASRRNDETTQTMDEKRRDTFKRFFGIEQRLSARYNKKEKQGNAAETVGIPCSKEELLWNVHFRL